jgi:CheY-like chemotaxis protein
VDDDEAIREAFQLALSEEGHEVSLAENGQVGLRQVAQRAPEVILLDMRMPVMDGRAFAREYHAGPGPHAPIIVITATTENEQSLADIGAAACLLKPFNITDVLSAIDRLDSPLAS